MKYSLVLVLISVTYVTPDATFVNIDPELIPVVFNTFLRCVDKTGVDSSTMQKVMEWNFKDNESVKTYLYCLTTDSGFGDSNGYLVKEKIVKLIGNHPRRREFLNAIDECNKLKGSNKYDTTFETVNCFRNTSPILFKL